MLFLGNVDKLIYFRFYRRVNLQEIITAQNEMPIPSKSIPTIGCKRRNLPSKKERNRQLFPFKKESFCFYLKSLFYFKTLYYLPEDWDLSEILFFIHSHCILMQVVYLFSQPFW